MRQALWGFVALVVGMVLAVVLVPENHYSTFVGDDGIDTMSMSFSSEKPEWSVGDAWRVQFDGGEPICWMVVVAADEDGYRQGISCASEEEGFIAAQIAAYDVSYLGSFDRDLAGTAGGARTEFFDWPLEDGKRWETEWAGETVEVEALFDAEDARYRFAMSMDDEVFLAYDYDPELEWWSEMRFTSGYVLRVHERETGWDGSAVAATAETRYEQYGQSSVLGAPAAVFSVDADDEALALVLSYTGIAVGRFELRDSSGSPMYQQNVVGDDQVFRLLGATPGLWTVVEAVTGRYDSAVVLRGIQYETFDL